MYSGVGVAQLVYRWITGWNPGFESRQGQDFSLHGVQIDSGAYPASYPIGTGDSLSDGKAAGVWNSPDTSI
jgi:hypothetical protein